MIIISVPATLQVIVQWRGGGGSEGNGAAFGVRVLPAMKQPANKMGQRVTVYCGNDGHL